MNGGKYMDSIIFDLDGTLWDSTAVIANAWNEVLKERHMDEPHITVPLLKTLFGKTLPDIAAAAFPNLSSLKQLELVETCCDREHEFLLRYGSPLYPHLLEVLEYLSAKYSLFIVSNSQAGYIEVFLKVTKLGKYFKDHLCAGDTGNPKGSNIREIMTRNGLKSSVYVGDTDGDHQAAREAGVPFVFASYGFGQTKAEDYCISNLRDLIELF